MSTTCCYNIHLPILGWQPSTVHKGRLQLQDYGKRPRGNPAVFNATKAASSHFTITQQRSCKVPRPEAALRTESVVTPVIHLRFLLH